MNKMYNEQIKNNFLDKHFDSDDSRITAKYVFYHSYLIEKTLDEDLYNFSLEEIGNCIANSNPKSINVAKSRGSLIAQYINWASSPEVNLRKSNINPLLSIDDSWYEQFVDKNIKKFISRNELDQLIDNTVNKSDKAILKLLFEGISGRECSEIRNLKIDDIIDNDTIHVVDDIKGTERTVKVEESTIKLLREANEEDEYCNKNGEEARSPFSEVIDSPYIIKPLKRGKEVSDLRISHSVIIRRVKFLAELFGIDYLTPKALTHSGMIYMAYKLHEGKEKLTTEDFNKIGIHFNINKMTSNGYEYYPVSYMSQFINAQNINKLYGTNYKE